MEPSTLIADPALETARVGCGVASDRRNCCPTPRGNVPAPPSDAALSRVRAICYAFPGAEEKLSHGMPSFHVRGKMFVNFVDNHHADGLLAVWCKCSFDRQRELVTAHPERYFVPPYIGVRGWMGARLDQPSTDWVELAIVIEEGWLAIAPPKLARGGASRSEQGPERKTPGLVNYRHSTPNGDLHSG